MLKLSNESPSHEASCKDFDIIGLSSLRSLGFLGSFLALVLIGVHGFFDVDLFNLADSPFAIAILLVVSSLNRSGTGLGCYRGVRGSWCGRRTAFDSTASPGVDDFAVTFSVASVSLSVATSVALVIVLGVCFSCIGIASVASVALVIVLGVCFSCIGITSIASVASIALVIVLSVNIGIGITIGIARVASVAILTVSVGITSGIITSVGVTTSISIASGVCVGIGITIVGITITITITIGVTAIALANGEIFAIILSTSFGNLKTMVNN